jgi:hypothetical protein
VFCYAERRYELKSLGPARNRIIDDLQLRKMSQPLLRFCGRTFYLLNFSADWATNVLSFSPWPLTDVFPVAEQPRQKLRIP